LNALPATNAPHTKFKTEFLRLFKAECAADSRIAILPRRLPRHCEEQSDEAIHQLRLRRYGLLRFARNDDPIV
jgi:hypothetical protein